MFLNTVRILDAWYRGETYGINALRTLAPRSASDPAPGHVDLYNAYDHNIAAGRRVPTDTKNPALLLFVPSLVELEAFQATNFQQSDSLVVAHAYVSREPDLPAGLVEAHLIRRAVDQSRHQLFEGNEADRTLNQIQLLNHVTAEILEGVETAEGQVFTLIELVVFQVRDIWNEA